MSQESPDSTRGLSISTGILIGVVVVVAAVLIVAVFFGVSWGEDAAPEGINGDDGGTGGNGAPASYQVPVPPLAGPAYSLAPRTSASATPGAERR